MLLNSQTHLPQSLMLQTCSADIFSEGSHFYMLRLQHNNTNEVVYSFLIEFISVRSYNLNYLLAFDFLSTNMYKTFSILEHILSPFLSNKIIKIFLIGKKYNFITLI